MSVVALRASALNKCIMMNLMCPVVANEDTNVADTLLLMMFPEWANELCNNSVPQMAILTEFRYLNFSQK